MGIINYNGASFEGTAQECAQFMAFIGMMNGGIVTQSNNNKVSEPVVANNAEKSAYKATKDFTAKYQIKEQTATDGTKLFCISRANGWTRSEKSLMNKAIKELKGIKEIEVSYEKDGKVRTFKAWGYNTEATAKKHIKELPETFTKEQLNGEA